MNRIVIVGGGAAGFFAAANLSQDNQIRIAEGSQNILGKVKVSGGGRCNVTHDCLEPKELILNYPRGGKELLGPLYRFGPREVIDWFQERGVRIVSESDGRMFPSTNTSQTIIDTLTDSAEQNGSQVFLGYQLESLQPKGDIIQIQFRNGETWEADAVLLASGSSRSVWRELERLGHTIVPPVPSLFTFPIEDIRIEGLSGISLPTSESYLPSLGLSSWGPLLITHWGLSGPCILKLSSWAARELESCQYRTDLEIRWRTSVSQADCERELQAKREQGPKKTISNDPVDGFPSRLWKSIVHYSGISDEIKWSHLQKDQRRKLLQEMYSSTFQINGKTTYKEEFVTSGGVSLEEVNFKTMESKLIPGVYFAGEILNIDAVTGGFNFQNAWTTAWTFAQNFSENF